MEDLCAAVEDLDMESKYFETVPYDSDDPDFKWHENVSDFNEFDYPRAQSSSSCQLDENDSSGNRKRQRKMTQSNKCAQNIASVTAPSEAKPKVKKQRSEFNWGPPTSCWNNKLETSDSETDDNCREILKSHRRHTLASNSMNEDLKVSYLNNFYPTSRETARTFPSSSCVASTETELNYPHSIPTYVSPVTPVRKWEQVNHERSNRDSSLNRTFPLSSTEGGSRSTSEGEPTYIFKNPNKKFKKNPKLARRIVKPSEVMPSYRNYQLLGDSQLLRFSEQLLNCKPYVTLTEDTSSRRLGYCVSGQRIKDLEQRILRNELRLSENVIILIGTNDMVYGTELKSMCDSFDSMLKKLKRTAERIVILTVPPVAKFANDSEHILKLKHFNDFLLNCDDKNKIFVVDLATLFISYSNTIADRFFEPVFYKTKVDLIHLNRSGFKLLKAILDIEYFDKYY